MPKCSQCDSVFSDISTFTRHVRVLEHIPLNGRPVCIEENCFDKDGKRYDFSKLANLLRHFKEKHSGAEALADDIAEVDISFEDEPGEENDEDFEVPFFVDFNADREKSFQTSLKSHINVFLCKLYTKPNVPRSVVQDVVEHTSLLFYEAMSDVEEKVSNLILNPNLSPEEKTSNFKDFCSFFKNPFADLMTEYKRFKFFESQETYIPPVPKPLYSEPTPRRNADDQHLLAMEERCLQFVPIRDVLKQFLQQPGVIEKINKYLQKVVSEADGFVSHFVHGTLWKKTVAQIESTEDGTLVWPFFFYADDYECGNVLGSHKGVHKLCGNYVTIPVLPPEFSSMLNNMFLLALYHAEDRKVVPNSILYRSAIDEFKFLGTEGISINTASFKGKIKFWLALLHGDNLGLHQIAGFMGGFTANFPCRYCHIPHEILIISPKLDLTAHKLRTVDSYDADVLKNSPKDTGISESSPWNELPNFHVTENVSVDLLHDCLESGVCTFTLELILTYCVRHGYASLSYLNRIIRDHNYGHIKNKPPPIAGTNQKPAIKMSASEILTFTVFFGVLVGRFFPENDPIWRLYVLLRQIMDILFSPRINEDDLETLQNLIQEHHTLYLQLSDDKRLRNKHHHLLHYPDLIRKHGPPINYSVIRQEAFHQRGKQVAVSVSCMKNLPKTVGTRIQLMVHAYLQSGEVLKDRLEFGACSEIILDDMPSPCSNLPSDFGDYHEFVSFAQVKGTVYKTNMVLVVDNNDIDPVFGLIKAICLNNNNNKVGFVCQKLATLFFNTHVHAYQVEYVTEFLFVHHDELFHYLPTSLTTNTSGEIYIPYRYGI